MTRALAFVVALLSMVLFFSHCGENNGSAVSTNPPPVPGSINAPPSPGPQQPFPPVVSVPPPPSPGPVPYTPPVVSDDPAFAPKFSMIQKSILRTSCVSCHSSSGSGAASSGSPNSGPHAPAGGLDLTTYAGVMTKVVAGDPEKSSLYQYVRGAQMPPSGQLPEDQILAIQDWIAAGAKNN